jgi:hypothetical protein
MHTRVHVYIYCMHVIFVFLHACMRLACMYACTLHAYLCTEMMMFVTTLRGDTDMVDKVKKTVGHLEDLVFKQRERDARQRDLVSEWQRKVPLPMLSCCPC